MKNITQQLSAAGCALLGITAPVHSETKPWIIDLGVMHFNEPDYNKGVELIARGTRETDAGGALVVEANVDVITGASPIGASPSNVVQTFTKPSGDGSYQTQPGKLPGDDTHMDTRMALKAALTQPLNRSFRLNYSSALSMEFDYFSVSAGLGLDWDLNNKNTTLSSGYQFEFNNVHPVGNTPIPFETMAEPGELQPRERSSKVKTGQEGFVGLTQIIDRLSLFQLRYTQSVFDGYLNDGYKVLSVVEGEDAASPGSTIEYVYENRPDKRRRESVYFAYKRSFDGDVFDLGYRYYDDSWQVHAHSLDLAYKLQLGGNYFVRPNLRLYQQQAAFFYYHSLPDDQPFPEYASADYRLNAFDAVTYGLEYGRDLAFGRKHSITLEYYLQQGDSHPDDAIGLQQQLNLYPKVESWIIKYVYSVQW